MVKLLLRARATVHYTYQVEGREVSEYYRRGGYAFASYETRLYSRTPLSRAAETYTQPSDEAESDREPDQISASASPNTYQPHKKHAAKKPKSDSKPRDREKSGSSCCYY